MPSAIPLVGLAIVATAILQHGPAWAAVAPSEGRGAPIEIPLRRTGRIVMPRDAKVCVELRASRSATTEDDEYFLSRILGAAPTGVYAVMHERGVSTETATGNPRVLAIDENYSLSEECPDPTRSLSIILRLTQRRAGGPYRLVVEFRQGRALFRKGIDRRGQRLPSFPPNFGEPDAQGYVSDPPPPPWTPEGDASRLASELARLVHWEGQR